MVEVARQQQWRLPQPIAGPPLAHIALPLPLRAVLHRRGIATTEEAEVLLSDQVPPSPQSSPLRWPAFRRPAGQEKRLPSAAITTLTA